MQKSAVNTDKAAGALGPYSQGVVAGGLVFTSGQLPLTPEGELAGEGIDSQARQCLENLHAVLKAAGAGLDDLVKVNVFVTDLDYAPTINEVYGAFFEGETLPARSWVEVAALPRQGDIEIDGIAVLPNTPSS